MFQYQCVCVCGCVMNGLCCFRMCSEMCGMNVCIYQVEVLSSLSHRNIIQFFGAVTVAPNYCIVTGNDSKIYAKDHTDSLGGWLFILTHCEAHRHWVDGYLQGLIVRLTAHWVDGYKRMVIQI